MKTEEMNEKQPIPIPIPIAAATISPKMNLEKSNGISVQ